MAQVFKDLDEGKWKPFYLVVGDEPFQAGEIASRLKRYFIKDEASAAFNFESFDGEHLEAHALLGSLDTLPGLFDVGENSLRMVSCSRFDKISASGLETLDGYFRNPSPSTCFLILASKIDKRKTWSKVVDEKGYVIEVAEPYEREWPKWQGYFEKKLKKRIDPDAWQRVLISANHTLSLLWAELQKISVFIGERDVITVSDLSGLTSDSITEDIFEFAADVLCRRNYPAMRKFHFLIRSGENEIKLLSILVRQFRMVEQCAQLMKKGVTDSKIIGSQIGTAPFFVSKIQAQARHHTLESLGKSLDLLAEVDFQMKLGDGGLFERFLVPYFAAK